MTRVEGLIDNFAGWLIPRTHLVEAFNCASKVNGFKFLREGAPNLDNPYPVRR
jgi:hypothetical protein